MRPINQLYPYCEDEEKFMRLIRWAWSNVKVSDMEKLTLSATALKYLKGYGYV